MKSAVVIRSAERADLSGILEVLHEGDLMSDDVADHLDTFFVAESEGVIVGVIGIELHGKTGLLRSAAVLPSHRNRGIADRLVNRVDEVAREYGLDELILLTTTSAGYFARKGFAPVDRNALTGAVLSSSQFHGACPATAVSMRKQLNARNSRR